MPQRIKFYAAARWYLLRLILSLEPIDLGKQAVCCMHMSVERSERLEATSTNFIPKVARSDKRVALSMLQHRFGV